jgi:hypothetical protein
MRTSATLLLGFVLVGVNVNADDDGVRFFETKIRPLFVAKCYECHGPKKQESGLRLDTYDGIIAGGDSGPAIEPDSAEESLLINAVGYENEELQMPPEGPLTKQQVADLKRWIDLGAPHPDADDKKRPRRSKIDIEEGRDFWSFRPIANSKLPDVQNASWVNAPIDFFILARLENKDLEPNHPADKPTLIRRATFDLTGLPPTPAEIKAFLADESPQAFATVVDRLLASPVYGERWGRHWLDVARYADSNGLDENIAHGNAWRYRDYVVAAFNQDKPFDQFLVEQLAGDLVASDDIATQHERLIATGFLSLGPKVLAEVDETKMEMDIVDEQIDTVSRAFMGLTFGCARCHDHKFDPLRSEDYYALAGVFKSTRTMEHFKKIARWNEVSIATPDDVASKKTHDEKIAATKTKLAEVSRDATEQLKKERGAGFKPPSDVEKLFPEPVRAELKGLKDELAQLEKSAPELPTAMGVTDGKVNNVRVHLRGSHLSQGKLAVRAVPAVFRNDSVPKFNEQQSGRLQLAQWLVAEEHPLTSRVIVNRIWRWHFGRGLVESTDNFGQLGSRPSHPLLLDWLARRFVQSGWSIKQLHRTIMLSATYQMSGQYEQQKVDIDPENRLLWRMNLRRLEAEEIRDSVLATAGTLDRKMCGTLLHVKNREFIFNHTSKDETSYDSNRRSLYLPVVRNNLYGVFSLFDYSDASTTTGNRSTTVVAPQLLFVMNSDFVIGASEQLARNTLNSNVMDDAERIRQLVLLCHGREPTDEHVETALHYLKLARAEFASDSRDEIELQSWASLCHVTLACNAFIYVR